LTNDETTVLNIIKIYIDNMINVIYFDITIDKL